MDVFDIIKNRRSVMPYQYNDVPIKEDDLFKILEAANWAPTHKKTEPWRFKVFKKTSKEKSQYEFAKLEISFNCTFFFFEFSKYLATGIKNSKPFIKML